EGVSKSLQGYLNDLNLISYVISISLDYKYKEVLGQPLNISIRQSCFYKSPFDAVMSLLFSDPDFSPYRINTWNLERIPKPQNIETSTRT
ncbi:hypothetical protein EHR03_16570, partial [Leptospira mayottensis]